MEVLVSLALVVLFLAASPSSSSSSAAAGSGRGGNGNRIVGGEEAVAGQLPYHASPTTEIKYEYILYGGGHLKMHIKKTEDYAKMGGYFWVDQREKNASFLSLCYFMKYPPSALPDPNKCRQRETLDIIVMRQLHHSNMRQILKVSKNRHKRVQSKICVPFYANFALFKPLIFFSLFFPILPYNSNDLTKFKNAWFLIEGFILCSHKKWHKWRIVLSSVMVVKGTLKFMTIFVIYG